MLGLPAISTNFEMGRTMVKSDKDSGDGRSARSFLWGLKSIAVTASVSAGAILAPAALVAEVASATAVLEEIVVTARKKEELTKDVPISMTTVSGQWVVDRQLVQQEDFALYIPNFRQTNGSIGPFKYIRGAGSGSNASFEQAVGTFVDDVYVGRGQQARIPFFDIERVEFLRGPQVLVYGNSTVAGALAITTRRPGEVFEADASVAYEFNHQEVITRAGVTIPINERFRVRLAGFAQDLDEGWLESVNDVYVDQDPRFDNRAFRLSSILELGENLEVSFKVEEADLGVRGNTLQSISNALNNPALIESAFDRDRVVGQPAPLGLRQDRVDMRPKTYQAQAVYTAESFTLTALTAYSAYDLEQTTEGDLSPLPVFSFTTNEKYKQYSQEVRASGSYGSNVDFTVGVYFQRDELKAVGRTDTNLSALGTPVPTFARRNYLDQERDSWSGFLDFTYHVSDDLRLELGARYMDIQTKADQGARSADIITGALNPLAEMIVLPSPPFPPATTLFQLAFGTAHDFTGIKRSEDHFMPQAVLQYDLTENATSFLKIVRGSKAGGVDWLYAGTDRDEAQFRPEEATSVEAGVKSRLLGGRMSVDVTAFHTEFDDLQVSIFNGSTNFVVANAAKAKSRGAEIDLMWRASNSITLNLAAGYLDSTYSSFPGAGCFFEQRITTAPGAVCVQDLSGEETPYSSKWSGTAGIQVEHSVGAYDVDARVDGNFRSKYNPSTNNDPAVNQDGFVLLDARIQISPHSGLWYVAFFGKNLTDKLYTDQTSDTPLITGSRFATLNRTRQVGLQFGVSL